MKLIVKMSPFIIAVVFVILVYIHVYSWTSCFLGVLLYYMSGDHFLLPLTIMKWHSALKILQCHVFTPCLTTPTVIHSSVNLNIKVKIHPLLTCDIMNLLLTHCISSSVVYVAWSTTMTMHSFPEVEKCIEVLAMSRIYAMSNYPHCHSFLCQSQH